MLVCPGRYSSALLPGRQRAAPAKKRKQSTMAGSSSLSTRTRGFPQLSDSSSAKAAASCSMRSASFSSRSERSCGVVWPQLLNADRAAATAASTCAALASGTVATGLPVAGLTMDSSAPWPGMNLPLISRLVSNMLVLLERTALLPAAGHLVGIAGEVEGGENRNEGDGDDEHGNDVGYRALTRTYQL